MTSVAEGRDPQALLPSGLTLEVVAHHEAGHAVAAYLSGWKFEYVSIVGDDNCDGQVRHKIWSNFHPDVDDSDRNRRRVESVIVSLYGGNVAQAALLNLPIDAPSAERGCDHDFEQAARFAAYMCGHEDEIAAYAWYLRMKAKSLLAMEQNWLAVRALAGKLMDSPHIGGQPARRIIRTAIANADGI